MSRYVACPFAHSRTRRGCPRAVCSRQVASKWRSSTERATFARTGERIAPCGAPDGVAVTVPSSRHDTGGQELSDHRQDALVSHPTTHLFHQKSVMERPETVLDVAFYHPLIAAGGGLMKRRTSSIASCARRPGRNPYEVEQKSASKIGSSTSSAAIWTILSRRAGMPNLLTSPDPRLGISRSRTGSGA